MKRLLIIGLVSLCGSLARADARSDFDSSIASLTVTVENLSQSVAASYARLNSRIATLESIIAQDNSAKGAIMVGAIMPAHPGDTIAWPITLIPGTTPVSAIQGDIQIPAGFTVQSIVAGDAAIAAGKQVSSAAVSGGQRFVLFGLNQTAIGTGAIVIVNLKLAPSVTANLYPLTMTNPVASDPNGTGAILSATSGTIDVR